MLVCNIFLLDVCFTFLVDWRGIPESPKDHFDTSGIPASHMEMLKLDLCPQRKFHYLLAQEKNEYRFNTRVNSLKARRATPNFNLVQTVDILHVWRGCIKPSFSIAFTFWAPTLPFLPLTQGLLCRPVEREIASLGIAASVSFQRRLRVGGGMGAPPPLPAAGAERCPWIHRTIFKPLGSHHSPPNVLAFFYAPRIRYP